jgi:hypothetical protein
MYCINTTGLTHIYVKMFNWASEKKLCTQHCKTILQKWASSQSCLTRNTEAPLSNDLQTFMIVMSDALCPEDNDIVTDNNRQSIGNKNDEAIHISNRREGFFQSAQLKIPIAFQQGLLTCYTWNLCLCQSTI